MVVIHKDRPPFEYAVLVTSLPEGEVLAIAQMSRKSVSCPSGGLVSWPREVVRRRTVG